MMFLILPATKEAILVGYVDDIPLVVVTKNLEDGELYICEVISAVEGWLEKSGLTIVEEKREAILIAKCKRKYALIQIGNHVITSNPFIEYVT